MGLKFLAYVQTAAKYPLPQTWEILRKQFLEDSDYLEAYNRGSWSL